jgi:hypothetical protein
MSEPLTPREREAMAEPLIGHTDSGDPHPPSRVHGSWLALGHEATLTPPGRRLAYGAGEEPVLTLRSSKAGIHVTPLAHTSEGLHSGSRSRLHCEGEPPPSNR